MDSKIPSNTYTHMYAKVPPKSTVINMGRGMTKGAGKGVMWGDVRSLFIPPRWVERL